MTDTAPTRCRWVSDDPLYQTYHDEEWGRPDTDSRSLFEKLCLEGQQAGLSWITVLRKRENYRALFAGFDPQQIVQFDDERITAIAANPGIIRHRLKVEAIVRNARAYLAMEARGVSFADFLWQFVQGKTRVHRRQGLNDVPSQSPEAEQMSKQLKKAGFTFVGPTICYAFMQAVGMVNDHQLDCHVYKACVAEAKK
ncbi:DNA-3-methyladenine glycosylase I [Pokkaliibacter sp. CJK22405]|uniref:DNA-3-methyladenine glycosylase I n=1 Tax=Pokkaliibacter sp. CJK22405 TaxID=3384615 RepID=UPI0039848C97